MTDPDETQPGGEAIRPLDEASQGRETVLVRRRSRRYKRWNRRRKLVMVLVVLAAFTAFQVIFATANLHGLVDKLRAAQTAAETGQLGAAQAYADSAHDQAERADFGTWGPQFWIAEHLPWVGDNIRAARAVSTGAAALTGPAIDAYVELEAELGPDRFKIANGTIDTSVFGTADAAMQRLISLMKPIQDRAAGLPRDGLFGGLKGLWTNYTSFLGNFTAGIAVQQNGLRLAPELLGATGPRTYLVAVLNAAHLAPIGGAPVALTEITADHGRLTLGETKPASGIVGSLPASPDFSRVAPVLAHAWQQHGGHAVDGVLAVDPTALAAVLKQSGSFQVNGNTVTTDNVVAALSNAPYTSLGSGADAYIATVSHGVLDQLVRGTGNSGLALRGLLNTIADGHVHLWLSRPAEEQALASAASLGLLTKPGGPVPDVGVYLSAADQTNMDYYLQSNTTVLAGHCTGGRQTLTVSALIQSFVPAPVPTQSELLGGSPASGDVRLNVLAYGPAGGSLHDSVIDGVPGQSVTSTDAGHPVVTRLVTVPRGATVQLSWTFVTGAGQTADPVLRATPTSTRSAIGVVSPSACS